MLKTPANPAGLPIQVFDQLRAARFADRSQFFNDLSVASALLSSKIVKGAVLKIYAGAPHGMCSMLKDKVNAELLAFIGQGKKATV